MYTPKNFLISDNAEAIDFIRRYSFGTLVTNQDNVPIATHIPFTVSTVNNQLVLTSHIALANRQGKTLLNNTALAIFTQPHAYISPVHYENKLSVPTWNYLAVHAYGMVSLIEDEAAKLQMLLDMITFYNDAAYLKQWGNIPIAYKQKMVKGIIGFEILVKSLQGTKKLSQNKTSAEKQQIINALGKSTNTNEQDIAAYMAKQQ